MVQKKKQLAHLFDATQCISCGACILACSQTNFPEMHNQSIPGRNWPASNIRIFRSEERRPVNLLVQCQQCETHLALRLVPLARTITMKTVLSEMIRISASAATTVLPAARTTLAGVIRSRACR